MDKTDQARIVRAYSKPLTAADYDAIVAMFENYCRVEGLTTAKAASDFFAKSFKSLLQTTFSPSTMFFLEKTATASPLNSSMTGHWQAVTKSSLKDDK